MTQFRKTRQLLEFLKEFNRLRRKRITTYGSEDKVLWLADLPCELPSNWKDACRSVFITDKPEEIPELWLEVRKKRKPELPPIPEQIKILLPDDFFDNLEKYASKDTEDLLELVFSKTNSNIKLDYQKKVSIGEIEKLWIEYLENQWEPWVKEFRIWKKIQQIYQQVDFMRTELEKAEERYELVLAIGLLQWRDPTGVTIKRHILTAPAEISLNAARGILTVGPAVSFSRFRVELDMLELQYQSYLDSVKSELEDLLDELDIKVWDKDEVKKILQFIANRISPNAWVDENAWTPRDKTDETLLILFAPALVLRIRRSSGYDELITRFLESAEDVSKFSPIPWKVFVAEGEVLEDLSETMLENKTSYHRIGERVYFPLPMNEEQKKIIEQLKKKPYVVVKGPPGTGKSHTIANIICHLLASGERVLVTAPTSKALTVLHNLLPGDIPNLCVMALGSAREEQRFLEESIRKILFRKDSWDAKKVMDEINMLEGELYELEKKQAELDNKLEQYRKAETEPCTLHSGYCGTLAQIAKQLYKEQEIYGWFPEVVKPESQCPLETSELRFLAETHSSLTKENLNELDMEIGDFSLPDPAEFEKYIKTLINYEKRLEALKDLINSEKLIRLNNIQEIDLEKFKQFLFKLEEKIIKINVLGETFNQMLKDFLLGRSEWWQKVIQNLKQLFKQLQEDSQQIETVQIELPENIDWVKLLEDAQLRFEHFKKGGWRGFSIFAPKVVRKTQYIEEKCRIDGQPPRKPEELEKLIKYLELKKYIKQISNLLPELTNLITQPDPRVALYTVEGVVNEIFELFNLFENREYQIFSEIIPPYERVLLIDPNEIQKWHLFIEIKMIQHTLEKLKKELEALLTKIQNIPENKRHLCMNEFIQAILEKNINKWKSAWEKREHFKEKKNRFYHYQKLIQKLVKECPALENFLDSTRGRLEWRDKLLHLDKAWAWASTKAWLHQIIDMSSYHAIIEERKNVENKLKKKILKLLELKAWKAFFDRLDEKSKQSLVAWQKAMARIGKGTGKYAPKHRRIARKYLQNCIQKIPIWIMPISKVWETVPPEAGIFDTVIIDEASQAGLDSILLLLLGKRIIIIGDDKQTTPEAVGISEDEIAGIIKNYLKDFHFKEEFRPDVSLFDHAERAFGNVISLREHFRCVPEIIRFSNELCYKDSPLIPLRQPPPNRLPPLKAIYVDNGFCKGEGLYLINEPEADRIVETIKECIEDEAYKNKTMGVIVLQGHAQAELIERKLAEVLEPKEREERKLRCGVPSTFQGDERDVIFLSLVVARNHQYRALTSLADQRRFNVAMSRAKDQIYLFHSIRLDELGPEDLRRKLLNFFYSANQDVYKSIYEELERLEREIYKKPRQPGTQPEPYESWFEVDVALELLRQGYKIIPQFKVSGYRIDLVIEGLENRLAVECDGEVWHGPEQYEYDMRRQRQLERAGWVFIRIRESEFYANRNQILEFIKKKCEEHNIYPVNIQS